MAQQLWPEAPASLPGLPLLETRLFSFPLDIPAERLVALEGLLSPDELARAGRFRLARDRARHVAARGTLRVILGRHAGLPPDRIQFHHGPFGKPALGPGSGEDRLRFSFSGSAGLGVVALQLDEDVGVDIELVRPIAEAPAITERVFSRTEAAALRALPEPRRLEAFFTVWTRKEAAVKSIGRGLSYPLDRLSVPLGDLSEAEQLELESGGTTVARWLMPVPPPVKAVAIAVAAAGQRGRRFARCWAGGDLPRR